MHSLVRLAVTCLLHMSLLASSVCWLAGQSTEIVGWCVVFGSEYSAACMSEGWLLQQTQDAALSKLNRQPLGVRTFASEPATADSQWTTVLSDGTLWLPVPGVLMYQNPAGAAPVRIVAMRHWLCFITIALISVAWQWRERRRRGL